MMLDDCLGKKLGLAVLVTMVTTMNSHALAFQMPGSSTLKTTVSSTSSSCLSMKKTDDMNDVKQITSSRLFAMSPTSTKNRKPTPQQIEEAAGQREVDRNSKMEMGSVSGQMNIPPAECKCYVNCPLLTHNPELEARLRKLTTTRNYSLFVAEKAAKYLVDDLVNAPKRHGRKENGVTLTTTPVSTMTAEPWSTSSSSTKTKERLVILGAGWGSAAFLRGIDTDRYDVTCISPRNYFLFTPMLAGASVGTVDVRSITQPIRKVRYRILCI